MHPIPEVSFPSMGRNPLTVHRTHIPQKATRSSQEPHRTTEQKAKIVLEVNARPGTSILLASL